MIKKIALATLITASLSSCASVGEDIYSASYLRTNIIENRTTKSEIRSIYGVPDEQFTNSGSTSSWVYRKRDRYKVFDSVSDLVPGANGVLNTIGIARNNAETVTTLSNRATGNTDASGNTLSFSFENDVVVRWDLN